MKEMKNIRKIFLLVLFILINSLIFAFTEKIDTGIYKFILTERNYTTSEIEKTIIIQEYKNGKKEGVFKEQNAAGETVLKAYYKNNKLDGVAEKYNEDGSIKARAEFKNGEKNGVSESFGRNGKVLVRERYVNGVLEGVKENFRNDGSLFSTIEYKAGKRIGKVKYYYENGKLLGEGTVGKIQFPDGDTREENVMLGTWRGYYPDGKLKKEVKFNETGTEADVKTYFQNGKISAEGKITTKTRGDFWDKIGIWKYYYENGTLKYEKEIDDSERVRYLRGYYPSGKILYVNEDKYSEEEKLGNEEIDYKITTYYENGNIKMIEYGIFGPDAIEAYYPDGQMQYKIGVPYEDDVFYTPEGKLINPKKEDN